MEGSTIRGEGSGDLADLLESLPSLVSVAVSVKIGEMKEGRKLVNK